VDAIARGLASVLERATAPALPATELPAAYSAREITREIYGVLAAAAHQSHASARDMASVSTAVVHA
jgi:hypothetical protein